MARRTGLTLGLLGLAVIVGFVLWVLQGSPSRPGSAPVVRPEPPAAEAQPALLLPESSAEPQPLEPSSGGAPMRTMDNATDLQELTVSGRVVDESGRPVVGARVYLHPSAAARARLGLPQQYVGEAVPWDRLPQTQSGADGGFEVAGPDMTSPADASGPRSELGFLLGAGLIVHHAGYLTTGANVPRRDGWNVDVGDVVLARGPGLTGRVVDDEGRPVVGATVGIPLRDSSGNSDTAWHVAKSLQHTISDAGGRFLLDTLGPVRVRMEINYPGKIPWMGSLTLHAGEIRDLGEIVLRAGGAILGRTVDDEGAPLPLVYIRARPVQLRLDWGGEDTVFRDQQLRTGREVDTRTNDDGSFLLDGLDPHAYDVYATIAGREPQRHPYVPTGGEPLLFVMPPEALLVLTLVDEGTGEPLEGASATVFRRSAREDGGPYDPIDPELKILTGEEAARRAGSLSDGRGLVVASPAGFLRHTVVASAPGHATRQLDAPGVAPGERLEQTLHLRAACSLSGRVTDETSGTSLGRVTVLLEQSSRWDQLDVSLTAVTDADGRYRFDALSDGEWSLTARLLGWVEPSPRRVTLQPGGPPAEIDVVLRRGATIFGTVLGPDGRPLPGKGVSVEAPGLSTWGPGTESDAEGRFRFDGVPPGEVRVFADPGAEARFVAVAGRNPDIVLRVRAWPRVQGRVLDPRGWPVPHATIDLHRERDEWSWRSVQANAQGEYALEPRCTGRILFVARTETAVTPPVVAQLELDQEARVDLAFLGATLRGQVVEAASEVPLAGILVLAERLDATSPFEVRLEQPGGAGTSDSAGRFEIGWLQPGRYRLVPRSDEYLTVEGELDEVVVAKGGAETTLRLLRGGVLQGFVRAAGEPEGSTLRLVLMPLDPRWEQGSVVLPDAGEYRVPGLREGRHRYEVRRPSHFRGLDRDHVFASGEVDVVAGATVILDLVLMPMAR